MTTATIVNANKVQQKAKESLWAWYKHLEEQRGAPPSYDEFYPVRVEDAVPTLTGWEVDRVPYIVGAEVHGLCDFQAKKVLIPTDVQSPAKARFSLAHELGHVLLHQRNPSSCSTTLFRAHPRSVRYLTSKSPDSTIEREANQFATEFLMPAKAVLKQFKDRFGDERVWSGSRIVRQALAAQSRRAQVLVNTPEVFQAAAALAEYSTEASPKSLSNYFGVSRTAGAYRLLELNLVY